MPTCTSMMSRDEKGFTARGGWKISALFFSLGLLLLGLVLSTPAGPAGAAPPGQEGGTMPECVDCHAGRREDVDLDMAFASGEVISTYVDPAEFQASVHGSVLQCQACHQEISGYPHVDRSSLQPEARDAAFLTRKYSVCGNCHPEAYLAYLDSGHARALAAGNGQAAICSDCHGKHNIEEVAGNAMALGLRPAVYSCGKCHEDIFAEYRQSVHGRPLLELGDPNAPACVDCHGVHQMTGPSTADFRRQSPYMCAACHADQELMRQYGLSTQIMDSYVADFHGTTAHLFSYDEGQELNQAVCHDCHGVHNIKSTIDPGSSIMQENLVETCRQCHTDATANFPAAWIGHYPPSPYDNAPVYWIRVIYTVILTAGMAGIIGHVVLDMGRVTFDRVKNEQPSHE